MGLASQFMGHTAERIIANPRGATAPAASLRDAVYRELTHAWLLADRASHSTALLGAASLASRAAVGDGAG